MLTMKCVSCLIIRKSGRRKQNEYLKFANKREYFCQKQMISARAREECFGAGVIVINDYCKKYDSVLDIHKEAKEFGICVFQKS